MIRSVQSSDQASSGARGSYLAGEPPPSAPRPLLRDRPTPPAARGFDPWLAAVLALVFGLQLWALSRLEGYLLADSVEYMERAVEVLAGEGVDARNVRSFAFSALLLPIFALGELLGVRQGPLLVDAVRLSQMLLGLASCWMLARFVGAHWGRPSGRAAALLLGANPVFLQYTIGPTSGAAALFFLLWGSLRCLEPRGFRHGLVSGLLLGAALLVAFKVIPALGLLFGLLALRGRWAQRASIGGALLGVGLMVVVQAGLDQWIYGNPNQTLGNYLRANFLGLGATWLYQAGLESAGLWIYNNFGIAEANTAIQEDPSAVITSATDAWWYARELPHRALPWVGVGLAGLGLLELLRRPRWAGWIPVLLLAGTAFAFARKGSKSFRLWMPLLPWLALVCAVGLRPLFEAGRWTRWAGAAVCVLGAMGGVRILAQTNLSQHGGYWRAMASASAALDDHEGEPLRIASAYHWAVRFREPAALELVKLPHHLDEWDALESEARDEVLRTIDSLDWFLAHSQAFEQDPALMGAVNARFQIHDVVYDPHSFERLGPIWVLRARDGQPGARRFFEVHEGVEPGALAAQLQVPRSIDFRRRLSDGSARQMVLLGWDYEPQPWDAPLAWIRLLWYAGPLADKDYTVMYRATDPRGVGVGQLNLEPTRGVHPTSSWQEGWVVEESLALPIAQDPVAFGGDWCRGDLVPLDLWIAIGEYDDERNIVGGLNPFHPSGAAPLRRSEQPGGAWSPDGWRFSRDGLVRVGGVWAPVPEAARRPDDGAPIARPPASL